MVDALTHKPLGNTGVNVAPLSLGTVKLGRDQQVKYPTAVNIPSDKQALLLLDHARELGINLIDTAPAYGTSEERLGYLLASRRQDWLICTKVGEEFEAGVSSYNFSAQHCRYSVERSLTRLATDYLDIVLIHSNGDDLDILSKYGTLETLVELKQQGKIRLVGMSHKTIAGAQAAVAAGVDVLMATLNKDQAQEKAVIATAAQQGVGVLIKKALRSGHAQANELSWVAQQPGVGSIVVGTTNLDHLTENVAQITQP